MLEVHTNQLWISNAAQAREPKRIFDLGIEAVVDLALEEAPASLPRDIAYLRIPLNDGGGNANSHLKLAISLVADLLESGTPTVVACSAGLSRSPTIVACAIAKNHGSPPEEVLAKISQLKPLDVNGILWSEAVRALS